MFSRVFIFLIGAMFIFYQVIVIEDFYIAELMVESNISLEAETVLSILNKTGVNVQDSGGNDHTVIFSSSELVAECLIIGKESNCSCSKGYSWSNQVCYSHNCCRDAPCTENVTHITPLCIAQTPVFINGTVLTTAIWDTTKTNKLKAELEKLNGLLSLNITGPRTTSSVTADFEAALNVRLDNSMLQQIVTTLEIQLGGVIWVDTQGMVTIEGPLGSVCYKSEPKLICKFGEATASAGWNMTTQFERFELNNGSVVKLEYNCTTEEHKSCVAVRLSNVTGKWAGTYECGFTLGSLRHTARAQLNVALLPDVITMTIDPLTVDCPSPTTSISVTVKAIISRCEECYDVSWKPSHGDVITARPPQNTSRGTVYIFMETIPCKKTADPHFVNITFKNKREQEKSAQVDIPVIYAGDAFCEEDEVNGEVWPKAPAGNTVLNRTCPIGRTGYKSRTCNSPEWQDVYSYCVKEELRKVVNAADGFKKGLGATQEVANLVFEGLKNSSTDNSGFEEDMADIFASISVLNLMADGSQNVVLEEEVFPNLVTSASKMLNSTWSTVNESTRYLMSSKYLESVESLVKHIKVNRSSGFNSENLDLKFCSGSDCNLTVFDIGVNLNQTDGIMKTVAVKNIMDKLKNSYKNVEHTSLLVSATLTNNSDSSLGIQLKFPKDHDQSPEAYCVFWDIKKDDWSDVGCFLNTSDDNHTVCECNHLTSFSVLFAKSDISTKTLDMITNVGLGVSICSLVIFLFIEFLVWAAVVKSNLSHFRHTAIVNIATFLLLANCSFLASTEPKILSDTWCFVFTVCKHLFFLAMFSWMLCLSIMLVHQLIFVFSPLRKRVFMFLSSILGYVCPILIVGSSYVYYRYTDKPYYNPETCWLHYEKLLVGSAHAFFIPVGTVILANLFSMVVVIVTLLKSSVPDSSKANDKETAKSIIKVLVFLTPVFGLTWIIGFCLLLLDSNNIMFTIANYTFTILNSFQGLFLLITGCISEQKVREELLKLIMGKSKGNSESTKNLTSTTYTKDK
ncbi:adhesion G protein-coupled receptor F4 [Embiotoca jacksoni]|uniref:adhesion G protein-coupled receptor F4 n=1 Tax=Embiotoca jacksoni TaxID=100190 RepID=UPI0037040046